MCKYFEPNEAGNLASIEEDGDGPLTYLGDWGEDGWVLTSEIIADCYDGGCNVWHNVHINNCPMCGRKLRKE